MKRRDRILSVIFVLAVIGGLKLAQQLYRFYVSAEERVEIVRLERQVEVEGLGVIETQLGADSLRRAIDAADQVLSDARERIDGLERRIRTGTMGEGGERTYREELVSYNELVAKRNALFREWRGTVDTNHAHVDQYNLLVDSIRRLANLIGEPYYPILTPAEIMVRREAAAQESP